MCNKLVQHLAPHRHALVKFTPELWTNKALGITFTLAVDDFSAKYNALDHVYYLKAVLETKYVVILDIARSSHASTNLK